MHVIIHLLDIARYYSCIMNKRNLWPLSHFKFPGLIAFTMCHALDKTKQFALVLLICNHIWLNHSDITNCLYLQGQAIIICHIWFYFWSMQAMNFFAGLLLLLMPEENAFWLVEMFIAIIFFAYLTIDGVVKMLHFAWESLPKMNIFWCLFNTTTSYWIRQKYKKLFDFHRTLVGVLDDYFDGYYSEEMLESQVLLLALVKFLLCMSKELSQPICFIFSGSWSNGII